MHLAGGTGGGRGGGWAGKSAEHRSGEDGRGIGGGGALEGLGLAVPKQGIEAIETSPTSATG